MRALDSRDMLRLSEACAPLHPIDRTLGMLRAGCPDDTLDELGALPIGERERRAAALRLTTFGPRIEGTAECPACGLAHEIDPPLTAILEAPTASAEPWTLVVDGHELTVRVPDSRDQAAITHCGDAVEARARLVERCVLAALRAGESVAVGTLPESVVVELAGAVSARDRNAESLIAMTCAGCRQAWTIVFDAGEFLWAEVVMHARRLLREIDVLARAYHWSEADVLAMSALRRQAYLDLVGA